MPLGCCRRCCERADPAAGQGGILVGAGFDAAALQAVPRVAEERRHRGLRALSSAGTTAEIAVDQLIERLVASADGERLLVRGEERLMALSNALACAAAFDQRHTCGLARELRSVIGVMMEHPHKTRTGSTN